jgi:hypothetical protein
MIDERTVPTYLSISLRLANECSNGLHGSHYRAILQIMATPYELHVQGKTAEEILADLHSPDSNIAPYLQTAAQVRSNQELIKALKLASDDSTNVAKNIVRLTWALVGAAILQAIATGWNNLAWWAAHGFWFGR